MKPGALVLFTLLALMSVCADAQFIRGYGVKCGAVVANQTWDYSSIGDRSTDSRWGFSAAAFIELLNIPFVSAVMEVQYTQKGMSQSVPVTTEAHPDGTGEYITRSPRVEYLSIPALAKVRFSAPLVVPYLVAGPRWDFLLSRKADGYEPVINKFSNSDFGATLGAGVELRSLLPVDLLVEFRYNPSFRDAFNSGFLTVRNRSLDLLVGVRLPS